MNATLLNQFKDPALAQGLIARLGQLALILAERRGRAVRIMEVCGTHTVAIAKSGIRSILPSSIELISGPGCPVCVTANADIDRLIAVSRLPEVTLATFGDMLRVPGSSTSLSRRKAEGARIEVVYSPLDALALAQKHPGQQVVFLSVGFETTAPLTAATLRRAAQAGLDNFSVLTAHKRVPPALEALANDEQVALDALLLPGHVSTILGLEPYRFVAECYGIAAAVTGFEPLDLLLGMVRLLEQLAEGRAEVENAYERAVQPQGNAAARATIEAVFEETDADWRGLGRIPCSGLELRAEYAHFDAARRFDLAALVEPTVEPRGCRCGEVLRGVLTPRQCPLFGRACTPQQPLGPCMVSSEGSCAAYHRYQLA